MKITVECSINEASEMISQAQYALSLTNSKDVLRELHMVLRNKTKHETLTDEQAAAWGEIKEAFHKAMSEHNVEID